LGASKDTLCLELEAAKKEAQSSHVRLEALKNSSRKF